MPDFKPQTAEQLDAAMSDTGPTLVQLAAHARAVASMENGLQVDLVAGPYDPMDEMRRVLRERRRGMRRALDR